MPPSTPPISITVTVREDRPEVSVRPFGTDVQAEAHGEGRYLRVALRGSGDVEVRFEGLRVRDVDVRGGFVQAAPGSPYAVRAKLDGWLSVSARLDR